MQRDALFCGIDVGTSSAKVLACDVAGRIAAHATVAYALHVPAAGRAEQDADEVVRAVERAVAETLAGAAASREVVAVAFSCALHGVLPADANGNALGPLVTWLDVRASDIAARWRADDTAARLYARTGAPVHPMLPSCKLRFFAETDPGMMRRTARFVSLKELLIYRWTGSWAIDHGIASGTGLFDIFSRTWDERALDLARVARDQLSELATPSTALRLRAAAASALGLRDDVAIVLGSSDGALANLGSGATGARDLALTLGSSGAVRGVADAPVTDQHARTFAYAYDDARTIIGGATNAGAGTLGAFAALGFADRRDEDRLAAALEAAARIEPGAGGLTVVPFLSGERAPLWNPDLSGDVRGLTFAHSRDHLMRAAFESAIFGLRAIADVLEGLRGVPEHIRLSGGLFRVPLLRRIATDVFGRDVEIGSRDEASAFGAALFAARATGAIANDVAAASLVRAVETCSPDPAAAAAYGPAYERYRRAVADAVARRGS